MSRGTPRALLQALFSLAVLAAGAGGAYWILATLKKPESRMTVRVAPVVRTMTARRGTRKLLVHGRGTVKARTRTFLTAQVGGKVTEVPEALASGAFFQEGDLLLRIDPADYELALARAKAELARAERVLAIERREAKISLEEWEKLMKGEPDPLVLREPQVKEAEANVEAARAGLSRARLDLERTRVLAPYDGRVSERLVDLGQTVLPGTGLARIHAIDRAEVAIPVHDSELAFLDLPKNLSETGARFEGPEVVLEAPFAGALRRWQGRIVRIGGEIDPGTRMVPLIVEVDDPMNRGGYRNRSILPVGLFVSAEIQGLQVPGLFALPREALLEGGFVLTVDEENRLHRREVVVRRKERERVLIEEGLSEGMRVCLTRLEVFTESMEVRPLRESER